MRDALDELPGMSDAATELSNAMNKPPHNNAAKATAESQVAVLRKLLERALFLDANGGDIEDAVEKLCCEIHTALASLPDSAAKLRAVGEAFSKARKAGVQTTRDKAVFWFRSLKEAEDAIAAVAAYKASRR
jgi:hypothetical protein